MEKGISVFDSRKDHKAAEAQEKIDDLHKNIGELTMERDWLKKNWKFCSKSQDSAL